MGKRNVADLIHSQCQRVSRVWCRIHHLLASHSLMAISQTANINDLNLGLLECRSAFNGLGYLAFRGNALGKMNFSGSAKFRLQRGREAVQITREANCLPRQALCSSTELQPNNSCRTGRSSDMG